MHKKISNAMIKIKQTKNLVFIITSFILLLVILFLYYYTNLISKYNEKKLTKSETIKVSALGRDIQDSTILLQRIEKRQNDIEDWINQQKGETLNDESQNKFQGSTKNELIELEKTISQLEQNSSSIPYNQKRETLFPQPQKIHSSQMESIPPQVFPVLEHNSNVKKVSFEEYEEEPEFIQNPPEIIIDSFRQEGTNKGRKWPNYIPSGSYVQAVMIQGVDASAAVNSQSNPRPVVMRITSEASLPNGVYVNLKGCRLIGAAYGDVSSERGYIRLESISCSLKSRETIDRVIDGYIVGWDGTEGVRGEVVRREKELLKNSFYSGLVSGLGSGVSESLQRDLISPLGVVTEVSGGNVFKNAAAQGVEKSMDRLSRHYIEKAEQYHTVLQIMSGQPVDIVFKKGFPLQDEDKQFMLADEE